MKIGILAFAFGAPETILSNRRIAHLTAKKAYELGAPVYTQLDIYVDNSIEVEFIKEQFGNPPSTLQIARGAVKWAMRKEIKKILIIAAKPHLWRCVRDVTGVIHEVGAQIEISICKEIMQYPENDWFCVDSLQRRTQSKRNWERRENIIEFLPFFIYKFIAK